MRCCFGKLLDLGATDPGCCLTIASTNWSGDSELIFLGVSSEMNPPDQPGGIAVTGIERDQRIDNYQTPWLWAKRTTRSSSGLGGCSEFQLPPQIFSGRLAQRQAPTSSFYVMPRDLPPRSWQFFSD